MTWIQRRITLPAVRRGLHLITEPILRSLPELPTVRVGVLHVFLQHTSAGLTLNENADPQVPTDLNAALDALVSESFPFRHTIEGPDDMPAHVKSSLIGSSVSVPVSEGRLALGVWQGIFLCEYRNHASGRQLVLTLQGELAGEPSDVD